LTKIVLGFEVGEMVGRRCCAAGHDGRASAFALLQRDKAARPYRQRSFRDHILLHWMLGVLPRRSEDWWMFPPSRYALWRAGDVKPRGDLSIDLSTEALAKAEASAKLDLSTIVPLCGTTVEALRGLAA
jgi:hypothetical protein